MNRKSIAVIGASFHTGNLGVSALAESSIKCILNHWPEAGIELLGAGRLRGEESIDIGLQKASIKSWPIRFCSNPFVRDHFWKLLVGIAFTRVFPFMRSVFAKRQSTLGAICRVEMFADITGGDSFSDIYGMKRFVLGYLSKRLCQLVGKPFVMLPQTYGPFKSSLTKRLARHILRKATLIYSRDKEGMTVVKDLIDDTDKVSLSPDVAFILEPKIPERIAIGNDQLTRQLGEHDEKLIGLNISGLLYNGGYTGKNEFGLKCDYKKLLEDIITYFSGLPETKVLLVPHVVPDDFEIENDLIACRKLQKSLNCDVRKKVFIADPDEGQPFFDQCEIKYIIGKCDFFMGSRMHATIAAISQCIPTVGLAYSKKFAGVYETVGVEDCVVGLRELDNNQILDRVKTLYENSKDIKQRLEKNVPEAKQKVFQLFDNL